MRVQSLDINSYRNLKGVCCRPCDGVNVIHGENGQGKTNLIEAIWLFSGVKSFRGASINEIIPLGEKNAAFSMRFSDEIRDNEIKIFHGEKKQVLFNSVEENSLFSLAGVFCCIVFSPADLSLIKGGPSERRKSLDIVIGQIKPRYLQLLSEYQKQLLQRNTLLKDISYSPSLIETLDIWDISLAKTGALITKTRQSFVNRLIPLAEEFYAGISSNRESLSLSYFSSSEQEGESSYETLLSLLKNSRAEDIKNGFTSIGPHRDDLLIDINNISAKAYGSQGQQRSAVLSLKLGECSLIEQVIGQKPVVLLDDVMSELDDRRRDFLLHRLKNRQIFITCCDPRQVEGIDALFEIKDGKLL